MIAMLTSKADVDLSCFYSLSTLVLKLSRQAISSTTQGTFDSSESHRFFDTATRRISRLERSLRDAILIARYGVTLLQHSEMLSTVKGNSQVL